MELEAARTGDDELAEYAALFERCFPSATQLRVPYLRWLYRENPRGALVGFNARDAGRLVAHYACVPCGVYVAGAPRRALLSLNTATDPDYQGKGLFTKLAAATYEFAAGAGFDLVFGVANANSTPGFVRKLDFQLVAPLDGRVGLGRLGHIDWPRALADSDFRREWNESDLAWRLANPANRVHRHRLGADSSGFSADAHRAGFQAWAELPIATPSQGAEPAALRPRVFIGAFPRDSCRFRYPSLPSRLRASPLNFITRDLRGQWRPEAGRLLVSFLDFDAF